jgi:hypothetical protein
VLFAAFEPLFQNKKIERENANVREGVLRQSARESHRPSMVQGQAVLVGGQRDAHARDRVPVL